MRSNNKKVFEFNSDSEFISYVLKFTTGLETIILGGHFVLMYNEIKRFLEPAIWQEASGGLCKDLSKIMTGNFPLFSFEQALRIRTRKESLKESSKIALLVNDHSYKFKPFNCFSKDNLSSDFGSFRFRYYENYEIPLVYQRMIEKRGEDIDTVFWKNPMIRSQMYHAYLISETSLRNKFERKFKNFLPASSCFTTRKQDSKTRDLFFYKNQNELTSLTTHGRCGCSGEVMQFLEEVVLDNFLSVVMLVPIACYESVCIGVEAFGEYLGLIKDNKKKYVFVVASGFGDNDYSEENTERVIHVSFFTFV